MGYDTGSFSLFNQAAFTANSTLFAESLAAQFIPTAGAQYTNVYGSYINPTIVSSATVSVVNAYGLFTNISISAASMSILNLYGLYVQAPTLTSGTCGWMYGLYATQPTTSGGGTISNPYTAYIQNVTGIGVSVPSNYLEVGNSALNSGMAVGTYAGVITAPVGGVVVSGNVGIGTSSPVYPLDVQGGVSAFQVLAPQTTVNAQMAVLSQGYNQGSFGGGSVGTQLIMNKLTAQFFNVGPFSATGGLTAGIFDGRYVYATQGVSMFQYDTFAPFSASMSYSTFNLTFSGFGGARGMGFDGRYIYMIPIASTASFIRYDTTSPLTATSSYQGFVPPTNQSNYFATIFDGTYIYYTPFQIPGSGSGFILRYNTNLPFNLTSSYSVFDTRANLSTLCSGYLTGTFDGRYVYFPPYIVVGGLVSGCLVQYDTSLSFTSASSYQFFNLRNLSTLATGFASAVFDGRFVYLGAGFFDAGTNTGLTRYDTYMPFTNSLSYTILDTKLLNTSASLYFSATFDGRYVYFVSANLLGGGSSGAVISYDTTSPFNQTTSYFVFDTTTISSICIGSNGSTFDGQYVYLFGSSVGPPAALTRFPGYTGGFVSAPIIGYSTGLTVSGFIEFLMPTTTTATAGTVGASPSMASGFLSVYVNGNQQLIPYF